MVIVQDDVPQVNEIVIGNNSQEQIVDRPSQQSNDTNPLEASVEIVNEENVSPNRKKRKRFAINKKSKNLIQIKMRKFPFIFSSIERHCQRKFRLKKLISTMKTMTTVQYAQFV